MGRPSTEQVAKFIAWSWLLAGVTVAVLQAGHAGFHERNELPPPLHWLRDASLAVPIAAFALIVAALAVAWANPSPTGKRERASLGRTAAWAFLAAVLYAALTVPFIQLHGLLFGAEVRVGVSPLDHALGEGITVFQVAILLVPASLLAGVPWRDSRQPTPGSVATNDAADPVPSAPPGEPAIHSAAVPAIDGAHR